MTYLTEALTRLIPAVRAIETEIPGVSDAPDLLAAAIHQIERHDDERDRLVRDLAKALGVGEDVVRLSQGLERAPIAPRGLGRADRGRIAPVASVDEPTWYSTHGWEHRDDAHRVTFEGEGA